MSCSSFPLLCVCVFQLVIITPSNLNPAYSDKALLYITGGSNTNAVPTVDDGDVMLAALMAQSLQAVTAVLFMVPNQPVYFWDEQPAPVARGEDGLIVYAWTHFVEDPTRDAEWSVEPCCSLPSPSHHHSPDGLYALCSQTLPRTRSRIYVTESHSHLKAPPSLRHASNSLSVCWLELTLRTLMWLLLSLFLVVFQPLRLPRLPMTKSAVRGKTAVAARIRC